MKEVTESMVFATNNANKLREVQEMLGDQFRIISLEELGCTDEIPETGDTLEANSLEKASYIADRFEVNVFAEDTGLLVEALDGEPGVHSARYAGLQRSADDNMTLLLKRLEGIENRKAKFCTVFTLIRNGQTVQFQGECEGLIARKRSGTGGFGYDPIFIPRKQSGADRSFAELSKAEKALISHRGQGMQKLIKYLEDQKNPV